MSDRFLVSLALSPMVCDPRLLPSLAVFAAVCAIPRDAHAGWVTFKNDTPKTIVVQEFTTINGKKVAGKPYKLLPGESFREFQAIPGIKNYEIVDAANAANSLWIGQLNCKGDMQSFSVTVIQGKAAVVPAAAPPRGVSPSHPGSPAPLPPGEAKRP
ncbi:MAG: hypothetical protein RMJ56_17045 [Gemmataceae bacterium]|nr:hypothetical protein [Gemmata sp.]MDW8199304.1 hypothetical protein [Gemmataceae bacterium]